ncbi:hypothetical protein MTO96_014394 [Rhipicephalus appendiculatus]
MVPPALGMALFKVIKGKVFYERQAGVRDSPLLNGAAASEEPTGCPETPVSGFEDGRGANLGRSFLAVVTSRGCAGLRALARKGSK